MKLEGRAEIPTPTPFSSSSPGPDLTQNWLHHCAECFPNGRHWVLWMDQNWPSESLWVTWEQLWNHGRATEVHATSFLSERGLLCFSWTLMRITPTTQTCIHTVLRARGANLHSCDSSALSTCASPIAESSPPDVTLPRESGCLAAGTSGQLSELSHRQLWGARPQNSVMYFAASPLNHSDRSY